MLDSFIELIKKIPLARTLSRVSWIAHAYHLTLAYVATLWYGSPSKKLFIIGVTGTKGKTTTSYLIANILEKAGMKTGLITTALIGWGGAYKPNTTKQTMVGRFHLQRLLREMWDVGCTHVVVETSSEGILQSRHRFIDYRVAVFTNLSPEHIERHGGFENYRAAKMKLFECVARRKDGVGIYNLDDENAGYFYNIPVAKRYGYFFKKRAHESGMVIREITEPHYGEAGTIFHFDGEEYKTLFIGEPNIYNAASAISVALALGVSRETIQKNISTIIPPPGRFVVFSKKGITVIVDYAHEPASLEALYKAAQIFKPRHLIGILGAQGGGRDIWKREAMGRIAGEYCEEVILTNEDPYDEDPTAIAEAVRAGIQNKNAKSKIEIDRERAIENAVQGAKKGDVVVISGKGGEVWMCVAENKKIPWSDEKIVESALSKK